ncbi:MAG: UbiA family prenyltransferase [Bacteroidia bacterium]
MRFLKKIADAFIFTNIYLAVCVTSLVFETSIILNGKITDYKYPLFLFSSTLFLYCFHRVYKWNSRTTSEMAAERHLWLQRNKTLFYGVMILAGTMVITCLLFFVKFSIVLYMLPVALISFGYTIPFIPYKGKLWRLRDVPGIKIFLITLVLGLTTVLLPVLAYAHVNVLTRSDVVFMFVRRMIFIFAITIPFDIRDREYDALKGTRTLPVVLGIRRSKIIALVSLGFFLPLALIQDTFYTPVSIYYKLALAISIVPAVVGIIKCDEKRSDYFYSVFMEGTMLLQCLLIIAANTLV